MTTNPNRTPAGVPTGGQFAASAKGEATGIDLGATTPRTSVIDRAAARLADPEFVQKHPTLAALYADEDFLADAREMEGQGIGLAVQFQEWDSRENAVDVGQAYFDPAPVLALMDEKDRLALAEKTALRGYSNDEGDNLYIDAQQRGLVEHHSGPLYVYDPSPMDRTQVAAWDLANPVDKRQALMDALPDMYSHAYAANREAQAAAARAEFRYERLALAKRFLDEDVPAGSTVGLKIHGSSADEDGNCNLTLGTATDADGNVVDSWREGLLVPSVADRWGNTRYDMFLDDNDQDRIAVDKVYAWVADGARADY